MCAENYRTDDEYENCLVVKIVVYQCISAYGSLFYIAFYLQDIDRLRETLATLLISRQVIQNLLEVAVPWLVERAKVSNVIDAHREESSAVLRSCRD